MAGVVGMLGSAMHGSRHACVRSHGRWAIGGPLSAMPLLHNMFSTPAPAIPASCLQRLKTGQPVIDAVREGLYSLDSRAVAALLKELSKSGQPQRASGAPALASMA